MELAAEPAQRANARAHDQGKGQDSVAPLTQEKFAPKIRSYLHALTESFPSFRQKLVVATHNIAKSLARSWPSLPGYEKEKKQVLGLLQEKLESLPSQNIVVDIAFAHKEGAMPVLQGPEETAVAASLDADDGVMKSCAVQTEAAPLQDLAVTNGITVIGQPETKQPARESTNEPALSGKKNNLVGTRQSDPLEAGDDLVEPPYTLRLPLWELLATVEDTGYAQIPVLAAGHGIFMLRAAMENTNNNYVRDAFNGTNRLLDIYDTNEYAADNRSLALGAAAIALATEQRARQRQAGQQKQQEERQTKELAKESMRSEAYMTGGWIERQRQAQYGSIAIPFADRRYIASPPAEALPARGNTPGSVNSLASATVATENELTSAQPQDETSLLRAPRRPDTSAQAAQPQSLIDAATPKEVSPFAPPPQNTDQIPQSASNDAAAQNERLRIQANTFPNERKESQVQYLEARIGDLNARENELKGEISQERIPIPGSDKMENIERGEMRQDDENMRGAIQDEKRRLQGRQEQVKQAETNPPVEAATIEPNPR